jgi:hypothetical protein
MLLQTLYYATAVVALAGHSLLERDSTCPDLTFNHCPQQGIPQNFCCQPGQTCVSLAGNTTVLCCPEGADCSVIKSITCQISLQDITLHPDNVLKTTELGAKLPICGSQCCPFGYTCNAFGNCAMNANQNIFDYGLAVQ